MSQTINTDMPGKLWSIQGLSDPVAVALDPLVPHICHNGSSRPDNNALWEQLNLF